MNKESDVMREIHEIREKMYMETKDLSIKDKISYIRKSAESARKKYDLKFCHPAAL